MIIVITFKRTEKKN